MRYKSTTPPLCRFCSERIRKHTVMNWVEKGERKPYMTDTTFSRHVCLTGELPKTIADCRALTNEQVVSVRKGNEGTIRAFYTWDGESYVDKFFCSGEHARLWAYRTARKLYE